MFKVYYIITLLSALILTVNAANRPFPQEADFPGCIKPTNVTQIQMNKSITDLYDYYKSGNLKSYGSNQYYIEASGNGSGGDQSLTISEAHGYGMIIFALMAGYDTNAQEYFDGMYYFFKDWTSSYNDYLMSWIAGNVSNTNSATDGDMDIAYALILADLQWGSNGSINYLQAAKDMINYGIKEYDMSTSTYRVMLGDWDRNQYTTRSSDWMTGHLRAFGDVTEDSFWNSAVSEVYTLISEITSAYSPNTGLMPDFIAGADPYPDETGGGTGESNADQYWYNACRYPWRIALDYAHNQAPEAQAATSKLLGWLRGATSGDASNIKGGYSLSGSALSSYSDLVFIAPFAAGAITDSANQSFLNDMWSYIKDKTGSDEYALALNMLSMLLISGNWWSPGEVEYIAPTNVNLSNNSVKENLPLGTFIGKLSTDGNGSPFTYTITTGEADFSISHDSLFTKREFSAAVDNALSVTVKVTDNQSATASSSFNITVKEAGVYPILDMNWWIEHDSYGTTSADTGASLVGDSSVAVDFTLGRTNLSQGRYVWASLITDDIDGLTNSESIIISYRSDNDFALALPMTTITDYDYYNTDIPSTNGSWQELKINLNTETFSQSDGGNLVDFDLATVTKLSFDSQFERADGLFEIRAFSFDSSTMNSDMSSMMKSCGMHAVILNRKLLISNAHSGKYEISLHTLNGRSIYRETKSLKAGANSIDLSNVNIGKQMILIKMRGKVGKSIFKTFYF